MTKKQTAHEAVSRLKDRYPGAVCSLNADNPFELLISVRLSAQCTDARVNLVTPELFSKYKTLEDYASADVTDVENIIRSCGFFRQKARDIIGMAQMILNEYGGVIPDSVEELTRLPGVGRKTANLIAGDVYKMPGAVVADTHYIRISNRLGLVSTRDPFKVEKETRPLLPPEESNDFCHRCVLFGREICSARNPKCGICPLNDICKEYKLNNKMK